MVGQLDRTDRSEFFFVWNAIGYCQFLTLAKATFGNTYAFGSSSKMSCKYYVA